MPNSFVRLPADSTGKMLNTRERTVGANLVHDQVVIVATERVVSGYFHVHTGAHVVLATAHTATAGFWWLINPVGSAVMVEVRDIVFSSQLGSALLTPTSPRITVERVTFTGTASGATVAPARGVTANGAPVASLRTVSTGLTLAAADTITAFLPVASATAAGYVAPSIVDWLPLPEARIVLAAGEGIVCRQPDAGTAADTRRFVTNVRWSEFTTP